jgi:hypothetical protein
MAVRTLASVSAGEELCVSYIDLYQGRASRQHELRTTKHFDCACARCEEEGVVVGAGAGSDIRPPIVPGALLDALCCRVCGRSDAILVPPALACEAAARSNAGDASDVLLCAICGEMHHAEAIASACATARDAYEALARRAASAVAGRGAVSDRAYRREVEAREAWIRDFVAGGCADVLGVATSPASAKRSRGRRAARAKGGKAGKGAKGTKAAKEASKWPILHPRSALAINALTRLANLYGAGDEHKRVAKCAEAAATAMDAVECWPEASDYYRLQADALERYAGATRLPPRTAKQLAAMRRAALRRCQEIRVIAFGADHPATQAASDGW